MAGNVLPRDQMRLYLFSEKNKHAPIDFCLKNRIIFETKIRR